MQRKPISRRARPAKPPLSLEVIVDAALRLLAEDEGLERVTMRRIAQTLDTGAASLYVYVRDTSELHAHVLDALLADLPAPKPGPRWRADLMLVAEALLDVLMRHPEIARLTMATHGSGPNWLRLVDTVAGLLLKAGVDVRTAAWSVDLVLAYVSAFAVEHAGRGGEEDAELDVVRAAVASLDPRKHPYLVELGDALFSGKGERFHWGLEVLVRGIVQVVRDRSKHRA